MIRFNNSKTSKNKKLLISISNLIRKIFGGDRIKRLSDIMIQKSKKIHMIKKRKINILDLYQNLKQKKCNTYNLTNFLIKIRKNLI